MRKDILKRAEPAKIAIQVLDAVFLALSALYLIHLMAGITMFRLPYPEHFQENLLVYLIGAALVRLPFQEPGRKEVWLGLLMFLLYYLIYCSVGYLFVLYLGVLTVGFVGIDYRKILATYALTIGLFLAATVVAALSGAVENLVYIRGSSLRSAWGICYPTDFASLALFVLLMLWVAWRALPDGVMLALSLGSALLAWFIARSMTSMMCSLLLALFVGYHMVERRWIGGRGALKRLRKGVDVLLVAAFPIFCILTFLLMLAYHNGLGFAQKINYLMSDRLKLPVEAWIAHGVTPFGVPFDQIGSGYSTLYTTEYNFVDSSYPLILLRYGWVMLAASCALWVWGTWRAIRNDDRRLAVALAVIAFHSMSEHHFAEVNYNILLAMPFAAYAAVPARRAARGRTRVAAGIAAGALCVAAALALPAAVSWLRTYFEAEGLRGGGENGRVVLHIILGAFAVVGAAVASVYAIVVNVGRRPFFSRRVAAAFAALLVCVGAAAWAIPHCSRVIDDYGDAHSWSVEEEREVIEAITAAAPGRVYVDEMPVVYRRRFGGIRYSAFPGDDLGRLRNIAVVMNAHSESRPLIANGFYYAQISDEHGVYTDNEAVKAALDAVGHPVWSYYYTSNAVDLRAQAELNGLPYSSEGGVALDGPGQSLVYGPYIDLYVGHYAARFDLSLPERAQGLQGSLCTLRVSTYWGQNVMVEQAIGAEQFDEEGRLSVELPFSVYNSPGVEFLVFANEGCRLNVNGISCRKTPE